MDQSETKSLVPSQKQKTIFPEGGMNDINLFTLRIYFTCFTLEKNFHETCKIDFKEIKQKFSNEK